MERGEEKVHRHVARVGGSGFAGGLKNQSRGGDDEVIASALIAAEVGPGVVADRSPTVALAFGGNSRPRNTALDFTKGSLVVVMVLYHWMNYFLDVQWDVYRYLRFLTPSFIFIAAFIVSNAAAGRPADRDHKAWLRLLERGAKLLVLFAALNLIAGMVVPDTAVVNGEWRSLTDRLYAVYVTGNGRAIFDVLVPIAYFLMLAPLVLMASRVFRFALPLVCVLALGLASLASLGGVRSSNLELLAIAMLGMFVGVVPISRLERMLPPPAIAAAYGLYLTAITVWDVIFPLQVVGVCLSVLVIYRAGVWAGSDGWIPRIVIELGKYSLLGYIAQVVILQLLRWGLRGHELSAPGVLVAFLAALALTVASVELVSYARARSAVVDQLYRGVFA
jgi:hypothetical protein